MFNHAAGTTEGFRKTCCKAHHGASGDSDWDDAVW